ncbi:unnamed protein product [Toxocara canis]|uniref:Uncharacterized protein n=1 Tax=Toxocara canis TaxID=6265 RepID=A0A183V5U5_TOXCA|nr:unnamed protein product [Toxocara canis]
MDVRADMSNGTRSGMRKNRSTRWDTPTTSVQNTNVTASIPLPTGPPVQQTISLDTIPVPNRAAAMCPPISPHVALAAGPSSLNSEGFHVYLIFLFQALAYKLGRGLLLLLRGLTDHRKENKIAYACHVCFDGSFLRECG